MLTNYECRRGGSVSYLGNCHYFVKYSNSDIHITVKIKNYTECTLEYLKYLKKLFNPLEKERRLSYEIKIIDDSIDIKFTLFYNATTTSKNKIVNYACFCMLRFGILPSENALVFIKEWYKISKQYPKKSKFKIILYLNNYFLNTVNLYAHNFYNNNSSGIFSYEIYTFKDFLNKDMTYSDLNLYFKIVKFFTNREEKIKYLTDNIKKLI